MFSTAKYSLKSVIIYTKIPVFASLSFHTDLQDRKCLSPERTAGAEAVRKRHLEGGKSTGPGQSNRTPPTAQLHLHGGEGPLS